MKLACSLAEDDWRFENGNGLSTAASAVDGGECLVVMRLNELQGALCIHSIMRIQVLIFAGSQLSPLMFI